MRFSVIILAFLFVSLCAKSQKKYNGDSWASVKANGSGKLSVVYFEQTGLIQDVNGKPQGLCVSILNDFVEFVQNKYNKKITIQYVGKEPVFSEFLAAAQTNDNVLGVSNVTITEERKRIFKFTPSYLVNPIVLITHKDAPEVNNIDELPKKLAGYSAEIIGGSTHVKYINDLKSKTWPTLSISYGPSGREIMKKIASNPKIFSINDLTEFIGVTRKQLPIKKQNVKFGQPEELGFVMSKQSDWDEVWKEFLTEEYKKSSKYRKSISDNLGAAFLGLLN